MNPIAPDQLLQYATLFLAVIEFILALYVLLLNPWSTTNRHVGVLLFIGSLTTLGEGLLIEATTVQEAYVPTLLLAATVVPVQPMLLLTAIALLKPAWLSTPAGTRYFWLRRIAKYLVYLLVFLPIALTIVDATLGTGLWYTGLDPETYAGGMVTSGTFVQGPLYVPIRILAFQIISLLTFVPLLYVALRDREATPLTRRLAWVLVVQQLGLIIISLGLRAFLPDPIPSLSSTAIFVFVYSYLALWTMAAEHRIQRGQLRIRLTLIVLAIAVPLLAAVPLLLTLRTAKEAEQRAADQLGATNRALRANVSVWLDLNTKALHQLASYPDIVSMDPARQKPILELMTRNYPNLFLVQTTDTRGMNVARNDGQQNQDYSDQEWYQGAMTGAPVTLQALVSRTTGNPALNMATAIRNPGGRIVGVASIVSELDDVSREVQVSKVGGMGFVYVVDAANRVVAHPDPAYSTELRDLSSSPPIVALRQGTRGLVRFEEEGQRWWAYVEETDLGWGIAAQQAESEALGAVQAFQVLSLALIAVGTIVLLALTWLTISQAFRPVESLTRTAAAIAAGNLEAEAPIESEDEIGDLARTINSMTDQLRELIESLEQRVAERTRDLERRSAYLQATAEVGRAAASILETDQLLREIVELIRERFGLYYVGLFQVEEAGEWAVLSAGTGAAGQDLLARGHRIRVGEGMVGWAIARGAPRIASMAEADAVRLATAELPETRSEAALPLRSRGQVLGALTVQHTQPDAFDKDTLAVLEAMADQVAVAISNAQLFQRAEAALETTRRAYGEIGREAWAQLLLTRPDLGYRCDESGVTPASAGRLPREAEAASGQTGTPQPGLTLPVTIHGEVLGTLQAHKTDEAGEWTAEEVELLETMVDQLSVALDSARLYQDTQRRAAREQLIGEVATRMRETLELDTMLRTAASEMRQALGLDDLVIRMTTPDVDNNSS